MANQQLNRVCMIGNLTRDPELRATQSGTAVCSMRIANNRRTKSGDEWTDRVGYFDVVAWAGQAENCAKYLEKGRPIAVDGELTWREWQDKDGNKRQSVEINAREVQFLNSGDGGQGKRQDAPPPTDDLAPTGGYGSFGGGGQAPASPADDDIPF